MCLVYAPVAQRIEYAATNCMMRVRFLLGVPNYVEHSSVGRTPVCGTGGREFNPHCSTSFIKTFTAIINYMWQFYIFLKCLVQKFIPSYFWAGISVSLFCSLWGGIFKWAGIQVVTESVCKTLFREFKSHPALHK